MSRGTPTRNKKNLTTFNRADFAPRVAAGCARIPDSWKRLDEADDPASVLKEGRQKAEGDETAGGARQPEKENSQSSADVRL